MSYYFNRYTCVASNGVGKEDRKTSELVRTILSICNNHFSLKKYKKKTWPGGCNGNVAQPEWNSNSWTGGWSTCYTSLPGSQFSHFVFPPNKCFCWYYIFIWFLTSISGLKIFTQNLFASTFTTLMAKFCDQGCIKHCWYCCYLWNLHTIQGIGSTLLSNTACALHL